MSLTLNLGWESNAFSHAYEQIILSVSICLFNVEFLQGWWFMSELPSLSSVELVIVSLDQKVIKFLKKIFYLDFPADSNRYF